MDFLNSKISICRKKSSTGRAILMMVKPLRSLSWHLDLFCQQKGIVKIFSLHFTAKAEYVVHMCGCTKHQLAEHKRKEIVQADERTIIKHCFQNLGNFSKKSSVLIINCNYKLFTNTKWKTVFKQRQQEGIVTTYRKKSSNRIVCLSVLYTDNC